MERQGIHLAVNTHYLDWQRQLISRGILLILLFIISVVAATVLFVQGHQLHHQLIALQAKHATLKQQSITVDAQIHQLEQQSENPTQEALTQIAIQDFLHTLQTLPFRGGLTFAHIDNQAQLHFIGVVSPEIFQHLEQQLKTQQRSYQIGHIQMNDKHQLEFSFTLSSPKEK